MTNWEIIYTRGFKKALTKLEKTEQIKIVDYLNKVTQLADPAIRSTPLKGNFSGQYRYRVGNYRVIVEFEREKLVILAIHVGHRSNVYENK